jgi:hypothetical protein
MYFKPRPSIMLLAKSRMGKLQTHKEEAYRSEDQKEKIYVSVPKPPLKH